ncbi:hypothetical protein MKX08_006317 [Trichoderma sp. CBMAI-0020]|nr:hypothetical protein MKX08_006317 [Trichoderma sp. CBMAI-0020]
MADDADDKSKVPREALHSKASAQFGLSILVNHPTGAIGWMPCGSDIGRRAEFIHLAEHEKDGGIIFKRIRLWALQDARLLCLAQGHLLVSMEHLHALHRGPSF